MPTIQIPRKALSDLTVIIVAVVLFAAVVAIVRGVATPPHVRVLAGVIMLYGAFYFAVISEKRKKRPAWIVPFYFLTGALFIISGSRLFIDGISVTAIETLATLGIAVLAAVVWWFVAVAMGDTPLLVEVVDEVVDESYIPATVADDTREASGRDDSGNVHDDLVAFATSTPPAGASTDPSCRGYTCAACGCDHTCDCECDCALPYTRP